MNAEEEPRNSTRLLAHPKRATTGHQTFNCSHDAGIMVNGHEDSPQPRHQGRGISNTVEEGDVVNHVTGNELSTGIRQDMAFSVPCPEPTKIGSRKNRTGGVNLPCPPGVIRVGVIGLRNLFSPGSDSQISPVCWTISAKDALIQPVTPLLLSRSQEKRVFNRGMSAKVMPYVSGDNRRCSHARRRYHIPDEAVKEAFAGPPGQTVESAGLAYSPRRRRIRERTRIGAGPCTTTEVSSNKRTMETQGSEKEPLSEDPGETHNDSRGPSVGFPVPIGLNPGLGTRSPSTLCDSWPVPLDDEPPPDSWRLGDEDYEVLAAAERIGSILVRVVTWNLHAKPAPGAEELRRTLLPRDKFHIVAFGTEECLNSIAKSVILHSKKEWESRLKETLGETYEMLCGHSLQVSYSCEMVCQRVGLVPDMLSVSIPPLAGVCFRQFEQATHNAVFAHRGILPLLRNVRSFAVATGLGLGTRGATLGNKGGVGIAFDIGATTCIFINAHLAAHQNNVAERNVHFCQIQQGLVRALAPEASRRVDASGLDPTARPLATPGALRGHGCTDEQGCDARSSCSPRERHVETDSSESSEATDDDASPHSTDRIRPRVASTSYEEATMTGPREQSPSPSSPTARSAEDLATMGSNSSGTVSAPAPCPCETADPLFSPQHNDYHHSSGLGDSRGMAPTLPRVFDRVIWAGDLNYRVNVSRRVADQLLAMSMHEVLVSNEQLTLERARGGAFSPLAGYQEGPLNFLPTYKFDSGTDVYDSSSKQRVPAWTDRVLYAGGECKGSGAVAGLELRAYRSVTELKASDHRPVLATFVMRFEQRHGGDQETAVTNQTSSEVCSLM